MDDDDTQRPLTGQPDPRVTMQDPRPHGDREQDRVRLQPTVSSYQRRSFWFQQEPRLSAVATMHVRPGCKCGWGKNTQLEARKTKVPRVRGSQCRQGSMVAGGRRGHEAQSDTAAVCDSCRVRIILHLSLLRLRCSLTGVQGGRIPGWWWW